MQKSHPFPVGPVLMVLGAVLLFICLCFAKQIPWIATIAGLSGIALFFIGFRFQAGSGGFRCPHCGAKILMQNKWVQLRRKEPSFHCPHCRTLLRTDGGIII